jgi:hypothetical protein
MMQIRKIFTTFVVDVFVPHTGVVRRGESYR